MSAGQKPIANDEVVAARRELVARLRLRRLSIREIVRAMATAGHRNPDTGEPWSRSAVHDDLQALEAEWRASAERDIATWKTQVLAELDEVKRKAWSANDLEVVLKVIRQERDVLGLDAPERHELAGPGGGPLTVKAILESLPDVPADLDDRAT